MEAHRRAPVVVLQLLLYCMKNSAVCLLDLRFALPVPTRLVEELELPVAGRDQFLGIPGFVIISIFILQPLACVCNGSGPAGVAATSEFDDGGVKRKEGVGFWEDSCAIRSAHRYPTWC